jgi:purine-cytosine permease-like protein
MSRFFPVVKLLAVAVAFWAVTLAGTSHATQSVPEIDPASFGSVLTLVMGSLALLERRKSL